MRQRFVDAKEHQPDAHTGRKQHREPAGVGKVRFGICPANSDFTQGRYDQTQAEDDEDIGGQNEEPGQVAGQKAKDGIINRCNHVLQSKSQYHKQQHDERRNGEYLAVQVKVEAHCTRRDVVLTDHVVGIDQVGRTIRGGDAF